MANYSLVLNTKFDPFTFEEMFRPALMATQAQAAAEEQYQKLMEQAVQWGNKANEQTDPVAYNRYKNYADQLANYADKLSRYGLSVADRQGIMEMRTRYAKEITPIQEAIMRREKDKAAQQQVLMQDPTHIFGKNAATTSLDEYLLNPNLDVLSNHYSGALAAQQVGAAAKAVAEEAREAMLEPAGHMMLKFTQKYGYSPSQVLAAINNPRDPNASPILRGILGSVMDSTGAAEWASKADFDRLLQYASQGLWQAIGKNKVQMVEDKEAVLAKQHEYSMAQLAAQHNYEMEKLQAQWRMQAEQEKIKAAAKAGGTDAKALQAALDNIVVENYFTPENNVETSKYINKNGKVTKKYVQDVQSLNRVIRATGNSPEKMLPTLLSIYESKGASGVSEYLANLPIKNEKALSKSEFARTELWSNPREKAARFLLDPAIGYLNKKFNGYQAKVIDPIVNVLPILASVKEKQGNKLFASNINSYKGYSSGDILPHVNTINSFVADKYSGNKYLSSNAGYNITLDDSTGKTIFEKMRVAAGQGGLRTGKIGPTGQFVKEDTISKKDIDEWKDARVTTLKILPSGQVALELARPTSDGNDRYLVALESPFFGQQFNDIMAGISTTRRNAQDPALSENDRAKSLQDFYGYFRDLYKYVISNLGASTKVGATDILKLSGSSKEENEEE